jgi:hypothetical protein
MPILLKCNMFTPVGDFLSHSFWAPFSRLSYGAYLSSGVFILYWQYNSERGTWCSAFDTFLMFLAFLMFSYMFSLAATLMVEMPLRQLHYELVIANPDDPEQEFDEK